MSAIKTRPKGPKSDFFFFFLLDFPFPPFPSHFFSGAQLKLLAQRADTAIHTWYLGVLVGALGMPRPYTDF